MKWLKWLLGGLILAALPAIAWTGVVHAQQRFTDTVSQGETVNSSLYSSGQNVDIEGTVNGDVYCFGRNVTIDATVHGDVLCAGQTVTISGHIDGSVRAAAQNLTIDASIGQSASVAAVNFSLDEPSRIGRDLTAVGAMLDIKGQVGRDVLADAEDTLYFNGPVGRDVRADASQIDLRGNAKIGGNFAYNSSASFQREGGSTVHGHLSTFVAKTAKRSLVASINVGLYLFLLVGVIMGGLLLVWLFPRVIRRQSGYISSGLGKTLLTGLVAGLVIPILIFLLLISVVGTPLVVALLLLWLVAAALVGPIVGYYVGSLVLRTKRQPLLISFVGSVIVVTVWFLPFIGFFILLASYWLGLGALLQDLKAHAEPFQNK